MRWYSQHVRICWIHNLLLQYDGRDDWEDVYLDDEDDNEYEYDVAYQNGVATARRSRYHTTEGLFVRSSYRQANPNAYVIEREDNNDSVSDVASYNLRQN